MFIHVITGNKEPKSLDAWGSFGQQIRVPDDRENLLTFRKSITGENGYNSYFFYICK